MGFTVTEALQTVDRDARIYKNPVLLMETARTLAINIALHAIHKGIRENLANHQRTTLELGV